MTFEIKELKVDGSGYMVVTRDDGSTFGQMFRDLPLDDLAKSKEALMQLAEVMSEVSRPVPPKVPVKEVTDMVSVKVPIDPNRPTKGVK